MKISIFFRELFVLTDKITEFKSMLWKALAHFHETTQAVKPSFYPCSNDFSESVDESQDNCGANGDGDSFNDVGQTNSSEHGEECT